MVDHRFVCYGNSKPVLLHSFQQLVKAFSDGMGFVQFYFGLPIAMVIICLVFIPLYHRLKVYPAYEFLENRFDLKTRSLTAILFLIQRGLAAGITIFAPAIILSVVLGWNIVTLNIVIGVLVIIYTQFLVEPKL